MGGSLATSCRGSGWLPIKSARLRAKDRRCRAAGCRGELSGPCRLPIMMPNDGADSAAACRTTIVKTADYADSAAVCSDVIQGPCSYRKKENSFPLYKKGQEPCSRATQGKRGSAALRRLQGVQGKWHARHPPPLPPPPQGRSAFPALGHACREQVGQSSE